MVRIHEVISQLAGWTIGKRIIDSKYGDQKTVYYRNPDNYPEDNPNDNYLDPSKKEYSDYYELARE